MEVVADRRHKSKYRQSEKSSSKPDCLQRYRWVGSFVLTTQIVALGNLSPIDSACQGWGGGGLTRALSRHRGTGRLRGSEAQVPPRPVEQRR